jgi:hypothetical protein
MIAHLDGGEDTVLKNYTIPRAIAGLVGVPASV